ncbi:GNAT family N-acetyltransferase [Pendulispora brunnea]|uniref:GNAT family N-acetyltransferase n=1 Tax=Pendulispora brunnea TaxID=2905690 RepID=A0ABZ2K456_9BACT
MASPNTVSATPDHGILYRRVDHTKDREGVLGILREYFASIGEPGTADARYTRLYLDNPAQQACTFVATDGATGEVVGITSLFPRPVWVRGQTFLGAIGGDGYVTPRYRRRGIITKLHREALRAMNDRHEAVSFMFGPPEPNNLKALLQAGASQVGHVQRFVRPFTARGFGGARATALATLGQPLAWALGPRKTSLRLIELGERPDARVDRVWQATIDALAGRDQVVPVRDAVFYAWRFGRGEQRGYIVLDGETPVAAVALERNGQQAAIVDVTAPPRWMTRAYRAILDACRGVDSVHVELHVPSTRLQMMLYRLAFLPRTRKPFQVQTDRNHPAYDTLVRAEAWRYMWGDGDVFHVL